MEMEPQEKLSMLFGEKQRQGPSSEQLELIGKWLAIFSEMHHRELSPVGTAAYIEGLKDLTVAEIQRACERALKEVDRMPTVAHIRERRFEERILEDYIRTEQGERGCSMCDFTGWRMERRPDGLGNWARKCDCRRTVANPD